MDMNITNIPNINIDMDTDSQDSGTTFQFELSEYGNTVPFKIIKLEQDTEPALLSVAPSEPSECTDNPGSSNVDLTGTSPDSILSGPPNERARKKPSNQSKRIYRLENELSSDEYSSDGDLAVNNNSDSDSEYENFSDSDNPFESKNGDSPDVLNDSDRSENSQDQPPTPEWTSDSTCMIKLKFNKKREIRITPPRSPYEAFRLFLNDELLDTLVQETNKYAASICNTPSIPLNSKFKSWTNVTREEMLTFIALLIHTGTIRTTRLGDYWKQDYLFNMTCFSKFMSKNRFFLILTCLSFEPPPSFCPVPGHINKIQHIINNFNKTMTRIYYPGKELILTKSIVCWRGPMVRLEYIDFRRQKDGINVYMLVEPNGSIIKMQVYTGNVNQSNLKVKAGEIVKELLEDHQGNGHAIYMDKCYTSCKLATSLLESQTYCTGTLSKHSKDNLFQNADSDFPKQTNQSFFRNGVHIGKWVDNNNKSVLYISTEFDDQLLKVIQKNGILAAKPKALINYSKNMTASELHHQLKSYYPCGSKALPWHKKLFMHFLQIYLGNAHQLYSYSGKKKYLYYDFRLALLKAMLPEPAEPPPRSLQLSHALTKITKVRHRYRLDKDRNIERTMREIVRKECTMCRKMNKRRGTPFECLGCEGAPGFCTSCFCKFHSTQITE